jgi:hypothetical protein
VLQRASLVVVANAHDVIVAMHPLPSPAASAGSVELRLSLPDCLESAPLALGPRVLADRLLALHAQAAGRLEWVLNGLGTPKDQDRKDLSRWQGEYRELHRFAAYMGVADEVPGPGSVRAALVAQLGVLLRSLQEFRDPFTRRA